MRSVGKCNALTILVDLTSMVDMLSPIFPTLTNKYKNLKIITGQHQ